MLSKADLLSNVSNTKKNAKIKIYLIRMKGACGKTTLLAEFDN